LNIHEHCMVQLRQSSQALSVTQPRQFRARGAELIQGHLIAKLRGGRYLFVLIATCADKVS
jgi:hypothetical protein